MPRLCAVLIVWMVVLPGSPAAQTIDPVATLRTALEGESDLTTREAASAHAKRLDSLARRIRSSADLIRAVTLPTWWTLHAQGSPIVEDDLVRFKAGLRVRLGKKLLTALTRELARGESKEQVLALLTLIRLSAIDEELRLAPPVPSGPADVEARREGHATIFPGLAPAVTRLAATTEESAIRWAALRTLATLQPPVPDLAKLLTKALEARALRERQIAAAVMIALFPAHPGRTLPFNVLNERIVTLLPLAAKGSRDEDPVVRRRCLLVIAYAVQRFDSEARQLPPLSDAPPKVSKRLNPALKAIAEALPAAVARLSERDVELSLAAHLALEKAATLRLALPRPQRLLAPRTDDTPAPKGAGEEEQDLEDKEIFPAKGPRLEVEALAQATLKAIPRLEKSLSHKEIRIQLAALHVLETLAEDSAPVAGTLAKLVKDDIRLIRLGAARALRNMAPAGAESVAALAEALADDSADVRRTAAVALGRFGRKAKGALKPLVKALEHKDARLRLEAARALANLEADAKPARTALVTRLKGDAQAGVRAAAATALGRTGPLDAPTREALVEALEDADATVQSAAASALLRKDL